MPLTAPRFAGEPTLEACLAGSHRMLAPEISNGVRLVQEALLDLGFSLPKHGADSKFGTETGDAVTLYKRQQGLQPTDPVVGPGTMAALDRDFADKPPAPFRDRDEWLSWRDRGNTSLAGFNFTRRDELTRRAAGTPFTFDAPSMWMPQTLRDGFSSALSALLEPTGSPLGPGMPAATFGIGPFDLYHAHLAIRKDPLNPLAGPSVDGSETRRKLDALRMRADATPGAVRGDATWSAAYRHLIINGDALPAATQTLNTALASATPAMPLVLIWHSFEDDRWRPKSIASNSPQRGWLSQVAPFSVPPVPFPLGEPVLPQFVHSIFQIDFLVTKAGVATVTPGIGEESWCLAGLAVNDVTAALIR